MKRIAAMTLLVSTFIWLPQSHGDIVEVQRVVYQTVGNREMHMELFIPIAVHENRPALIWFHGGGWQSGTPKQFEPQSRYLASKGILCACVEYRLTKTDPFPACLNDCKAAVRYLRAHGKKYGIDPGRIGVGGGSAGGHLAAMVGLTPGKFEGDGPHPEVSSKPDLMILFNPPTDLRPFGESPLIKKLLTDTSDERLAEVSPIVYVSKEAPPCLALHGNKDTTVPHVHSDSLVRELRQKGVTAELFTAPDAGHGWFNRGKGYDTTLRRVEEFLNKQGFLTR